MKAGLWIFIAFLVCGCEHSVPVASPIQQPPAAPSAPKTVGIFYADDLAHYRCETGKGYIFDRYVFELGPQSIAMFDTIFSGLFQKIDHLAKEPADGGEGGRDTITIHLVGFDGCEASWPILGTTTIHVAYEGVFRSKAGDIARVRGAGQADSYDIESNEMTDAALYLGGLLQIAMRRAAAQFVLEFEQRPELQDWRSGL